MTTIGVIVDIDDTGNGDTLSSPVFGQHFSYYLLKY